MRYNASPINLRQELLAFVAPMLEEPSDKLAFTMRQGSIFGD